MRKVVTLILSFISCLLWAQHEENTWTLTATDPNHYVGAPVANGGIGILPWAEPFSVQHVILNHVFESNGPRGISCVLKGINPFVLSMEIDGQRVDKDNCREWKQVIDMKEATHNSFFNVMDKAKVSYSICALRNMPYAGLIRVQLTALEDLFLKVDNVMEIPSGYIQPVNEIRTLREGDHLNQVVYQCSATSSQGTYRVAATSSFIDPEHRFSIGQDKHLSLSAHVKKGEQISFALVGAVCSTRDFSDPFGESEREVVYACYEGTERMMQAHRRMWEELWQGDILIEGDEEAQKSVRFALYNLYSFGREGSRLSISPMGLSSQGYSGHIFWDAEIWMYPPLLMLNQGIAESMLDYRIDRLEAARKKAYVHGYRGAMFPWESDDSGHEATPTWVLTGPFEHHITADVAIAVWNYYCVTQDKVWLKREGYPLLKAVADFWVSRVEPNADGSYSIANVTGADEYANGVTDNAFTNGAVIRALEDAIQAAAVCGESVPSDWKKVKNGIRIHSFDNGGTREYKGYNGEMIKQADANLLGYPLGIIKDAETLKKDLAYYADKIDQANGPAMSYSIFCIQYARLGDAKMAYEMFERCYKPNLRSPFGVLAETATSQNPYFATGAGGLLQAVINGFGGLEITKNGIKQVSSVLPPHWKKLTLKGIGKNRETFVVTQ